MKLSELVAYQNQIDNLSSIPLIKLTADGNLVKIVHLVEDQPFVPAEYVAGIVQARNQLHTAFDNVAVALEKFKEQLKHNIAQQETHYYEQSYKLYLNKLLSHCQNGYYSSIQTFRDDFGNLRPILEDNKIKYCSEVNASIAKQILEITEDTKKILLSRLSTYASWLYPAALIRPNVPDFLNVMVANDPLYLLDEHPDLLAPVVSGFNAQYQNRLRTYVINEIPDCAVLDSLPNGQFGFFLVYNYFHHRPFEMIKTYLEEIFQKLRPGGVIGMTFNNCSRYSAVVLVEHDSACYTPQDVMLGMMKNIGYKNIFQCDDGPVTWIELQKPGNLTSIRGGQTLAKITLK